MTEVWFRNPVDYIRELVECNELNVVLDYGQIVKSHIEPVKWISAHYGDTVPWRLITMGEDGAAEYRPGTKFDHNPVAVYPCWAFGDDMSLLIEMLENPAGEDEASCKNMSLDVRERPILGQEHRVIVHNLPSVSEGPTRRFLNELRNLQVEHPEAIIHLHGVFSPRVNWGMGWGAADDNPRFAASGGTVNMPSGKQISYKQLIQHSKWVHLLGFAVPDLDTPRNRCMFNIKADRWNAENWEEPYNFRTRNGTAPSGSGATSSTKRVLSSPRKTQLADKYICDTCTLALSCKFFRSGAVCSLPGAEPTPLAAYFGTRNADSIIDGLGILLSQGVRRLERAMEDEVQFGDPGDPSREITKMHGQVFDQGVKLAKLIDPNLRAAGLKVGINVGSNSGVQIIAGDPRDAVAAAVRQLELEGIPRDKITPSMLEAIFKSQAGSHEQQQAVQNSLPSSGRVYDPDDELEF